ncbi:hypothetical protein BCR35DRAFT_333678 [Leucosporidium creatinivorum]|uniref:Uncharacterized protein n=1 Tax=Leucosporidium creatinivorum TaxID=106004 RepID=A0A1Y2EQ56_9BASI|nr:hypothetical protein BCR35DRAFT_333678 [Leucosporidium creatinivorum]
MLSAAGFSCVLVVDGRKMDVSRHQYQDSSASRVSAMVLAPLQRGSKWTIGWKDERLERGETSGTVWMREGPTAASRMAAAPVRFKPGDTAYPIVAGQLVDVPDFMELRLVVNLVNGDGSVDFTPFAVFSFSMSSGAQHFAPTPLAAIAGAPLGVGRTLYETGAMANPSSFPSGHQPQAASQKRSATLGILSARTNAPAPIASTASSPSGSIFLHDTRIHHSSSFIPPPNNYVLEQALQNERELLHRLRNEKESASFYEKAVGALYSRLSSRQLVAYLDDRLTTEQLSATMRVSVALARQQALERIEAEDSASISRELRQLLSLVTSSRVVKPATLSSA